MAADISHLTGLAPVEPLDLNTYPVNRKSSFRLPPAGRYTMRAPDQFTADSFTQSKAGSLLVAINPTVADGPHEGFQLRKAQSRVSAKVYERDGQPVSQVGDYLVALGYKGPLASDQDVADAVEGTAGRTYQADLDWIAENYNTGFKVRGMKNFPKNADGTFQQWVDDPTEKDLTRTDADGNPVPKRLWANVFIRNFIPAAE